MSSIYSMIFEELESKIKHLPKMYSKYQPALDALNEEAVSDIILDGNNNVFWFEYSCYTKLTDKQCILLKTYIKQKGYKYLGDTFAKEIK